MLNGIFFDKKTGEQVRIIKEEDNLYVLDSNVRIKKDIFAKKYEERLEVNPDIFFQTKLTTDPLANIANQIKNLDTTKIIDGETGTKVKYTPPIVLADSSNPNSTVIKQSQVVEPIHLTPEQKRAMLDEWRRTQPGAQIQTPVQENTWDDESAETTETQKPIATDYSGVARYATSRVSNVDPMEMMFKMFKNNYLVKFNIEIEDNIPNPTFIGMVQENVEADAIKYYADLISDRILKEPSRIKTSIYEQLKMIIEKELDKK